MWGQSSLTFHGHEYKEPLEVHESFEGMSDEELRSYAAILVPSGMVSDRLRYTEDLKQLPPATEFLRRAFAEKTVLKGMICHALWLAAPTPELVRGRKMVMHNNLYGDACNMGVIYVDADAVVDGDLVSARTGGHAHQFANKIIEMLERDTLAHQGNSVAFSHVALNCKDQAATEAFYTKYLDYKRARVIPIGEGKEIIFLKNVDAYLELFPADGESPIPPYQKDGPTYPAIRHMAFKVDDVQAKLQEMGADAKIMLGPFHFDDVIPGWMTVWVQDPDGNIVEISQGYQDQD